MFSSYCFFQFLIAASTAVVLMFLTAATLDFVLVCLGPVLCLIAHLNHRLFSMRSTWMHQDRLWMQKDCILLFMKWYPPEFCFLIVALLPYSLLFTKLPHWAIFTCLQTKLLGNKPILVTECGMSDFDETTHAYNKDSWLHAYITLFYSYIYSPSL